jgi:hypothetical protein
MVQAQSLPGGIGAISKVRRLKLDGMGVHLDSLVTIPWKGITGISVAAERHRRRDVAGPLATLADIVAFIFVDWWMTTVTELPKAG